MTGTAVRRYGAAYDFTKAGSRARRTRHDAVNAYAARGAVQASGIPRDPVRPTGNRW